MVEDRQEGERSEDADKVVECTGAISGLPLGVDRSTCDNIFYTLKGCDNIPIGGC